MYLKRAFQEIRNYQTQISKLHLLLESHHKKVDALVQQQDLDARSSELLSKTTVEVVGKVEEMRCVWLDSLDDVTQQVWPFSCKF